MKKRKWCDLLCVCVNAFPKYRNKIYPEVAQQWSHGELRSLHVQFYMLSFAPELWRCGSGCWAQAAAGAFCGPLGYENSFYMPDASLLLPRGDVNFSDRFQLGSFCGTSDRVFNLYFCCWRHEIETTYLHDTLLAYADLWGRGSALWRCLQRIGCDFCKEGLSACSSVTAYAAQGLPRCLRDIIALSANTEELPVP